MLTVGFSGGLTVGLELGSELVVEGGAVGLEVELVVDRSLDLRWWVCGF